MSPFLVFVISTAKKASLTGLPPPSVQAQRPLDCDAARKTPPSSGCGCAAWKRLKLAKYENREAEASGDLRLQGEFIRRSEVGYGPPLEGDSYSEFSCEKSASQRRLPTRASHPLLRGAGPVARLYIRSRERRAFSTRAF